MKTAALFLGLSLLTAIGASAQTTSPWYVVKTPPYPGAVVGGPFPSFTACNKASSAYQGSDYNHQYTCEIRY